LGEGTSLKADVLDLASPVANEAPDSGRFAVGLAFLDYDTALVDNADTRTVE
jgi:hypothetical protein